MRRQCRRKPLSPKPRQHARVSRRFESNKRQSCSAWLSKLSRRKSQLVRACLVSRVCARARVCVCVCMHGVLLFGEVVAVTEVLVHRLVLVPLVELRSAIVV